ncbi:MAG: hypothetical protein DHS20C17_32310 [Cyclobacteriaceae bacterium]|nr:MAG: hypothetical protein DHS20C17_32310 [Cyclobacteriaceae bacterium]
MQRSFLCLLFLNLAVFLSAQNSLGNIQENTNEALPSSYNFQEYVFAEPDDQGDCLGIENNSAVIEEVFLAQTHRHAIGHPLFFTIGHRPALLQLAVTGTGPAPDVVVEGILNGVSLGIRCLSGPSTLTNSIDLDYPDFENYFSITLPKDWVQNGLELILKAGNDIRNLSSSDLKIGPYTEMNLVMVNLDVMDYNEEDHQWPIFDDFLEEMASAIPASVVRFGIFPETLAFQEVVANNGTEQLVRLNSRNAMAPNGINSGGSINSIVALFLSKMQRSTRDYLSTVYFGNTLNLAPGGWGGGKSFVSFDYTDVFIHELGHALSLPHWGEGSYDNPDPNEYEFLYPYGGEGNDGGGRGEAWNFIQDTYEFVDPTCHYDDHGNLGEERSDCMQRNNRCLEQRTDGPGPWDGYGDFSALAIHRYLVGAGVRTGQVNYRNSLEDFQFNMQAGFPIVSLENGQRIYTRDELQPQELTFEENFDLPGEEQLEQDVYLIYGSAHETQTQANIVYKPVKYKGTLSPIIDPTNPETFAELQGTTYLPELYDTRDIVLKLTYEDGSILHALNPFHSYKRAPYTWGYHIWRNDVCTFSLVVPGDKNLVKVELYKRPFCIRYSGDDTEGNINYAAHNITAANFMDAAEYQAEYEFGTPPALGSNTIGNRVWHDTNLNGMEDPDEEGIPGVSLVLWKDGDGDSIPDWMGFEGVAITDEEGYYSFTGLDTGNYLVFVWSIDNWGPGEPLSGMIPTAIYEEDPNTDINFDNNGRPGNEWGLTDLDIVSGMITLTADGEPLEDGDREDCWFDFDSSGNMTIDFGFHQEGATNTSVYNRGIAKIYPNPFHNSILIEYEDYAGYQLRILNNNGQVVSQTSLKEKKSNISTENLTAGMYFVALVDEFGIIKWSTKLVKAN